MPHTYTSLIIHYVFSAKLRQRSISTELQSDLWAYMGGIARAHGAKALAIGGMEDHVHILLSLPATIPIAKAVQLIKAGSSKWMREQKGQRLFAWQEAYGAFNVGVSQVNATIQYIINQAEHHKKKTFSEEFISFLDKHAIDYNERYVLG